MAENLEILNDDIGNEEIITEKIEEQEELINDDEIILKSENNISDNGTLKVDKNLFVRTDSITTVEELICTVEKAEDGEIITLSNDFVCDNLTLIVPNVNVTINAENLVWNTGTIKIEGDNSGSLTIKNLKIDGTNISGRLITNNVRFSTVKLENIEIFNSTDGAINISTIGETNDRGELINSAVTILEKVWVHDNEATNTAPAIWLGEHANLTINNSTIDNNIGSGKGYETGAISSKNFRGNLNINNSIFRNNKNTSGNTGTFGGGGGALAIHYFYGKVIVNNSIFDGNESSPDISKTNDGGAIYILDGRDGATFDINGTTFSNNISYGDGGAIYFQGTGNPGLTTTIKNSTFYKNQAKSINEEELNMNMKPAGGAIAYLKNGGSAKMTNNILSSTFIGNIGGNENISVEVRGGAIGLNGVGLFATAAVTRNDSLFLDNQVYGTDAQVNIASNYKDISNYQTVQAGNTNVINVQKGIVTEYSTHDLLGTNSAELSDNFSNIKAGYIPEIVKTILIKPGSIADNTYSGTAVLPDKDQRDFPRFKDQGAVEITSIKYDANGGEFKLEKLEKYDGKIYYELNEDSKVVEYYTVGYASGETKVVDGIGILKATLEDKVFKGWSTDKNAIEADKNFEIGQEITYGNEGRTLYVVWGEKTIEHTVIFEPNGGTFEDKSTEAKQLTVTHGEKVNPENISKENYTIEGWYTDEDLTEKYNFANEVTEDITLYAKRDLNNYTVTFEPNGGTFEDENIEAKQVTVTHGEKVTSEKISKENHTFKGWYTDEDLTELYNFESEVTEDITLYAKWKLTEDTSIDETETDVTDKDDKDDKNDKEKDSDEDKLPKTGINITYNILFGLVAIRTGIYFFKNKKEV